MSTNINVVGKGNQTIVGGKNHSQTIADCGEKTQNNSIIDDFEKALALIEKSSLDSQTVAALCNLLSTAKEATEKNDEQQKEDVKNKFKWFWGILGKNAKTVLTVLAECTTILDFFGIKL
jgi:hypothetical protein